MLSNWITTLKTSAGNDLLAMAGQPTIFSVWSSGITLFGAPCHDINSSGHSQSWEKLANFLAIVDPVGPKKNCENHFWALEARKSLPFPGNLVNAQKVESAAYGLI